DGILFVTRHPQTADWVEVNKTQKLSLQCPIGSQGAGKKNRIRIRRGIRFFVHATRAGDQACPGTNRIGITDPKPPIPTAEAIARRGDIELIEPYQKRLQAVIAAFDIRVYPR